MTVFKIFKRDFPKVLKNGHSCLLLSGTQLFMFCSINGIVQTVIFERTTRLCRSGQRRCCRKSAAKMRMIAAAAVAFDMMVDRLLRTAAPCCMVADLSTVTEVYLLHSNPRHTPRLRKAPQPLSNFFWFPVPVASVRLFIYTLHLKFTMRSLCAILVSSVFGSASYLVTHYHLITFSNVTRMSMINFYKNM